MIWGCVIVPDRDTVLIWGWVILVGNGEATWGARIERLSKTNHWPPTRPARSTSFNPFIHRLTKSTRNFENV